ncbi:conserved hypothetical protein [Moraxellaceae bacterium 17A]|nr:conserved hypothetical protein [Moraxellaceae bacterium 17A]
MSLSNKETPLLKQILTLYKALPKEQNHAITITQLLAKAEVKLAYEIEGLPTEAQRKMVLRHLNKLHEELDVQKQEAARAKANTYYLEKSTNIDYISNNTAMLLILAESFLKVLAPKDILLESQSLFEKAHKQLIKNKKIINWQKRLIFSLDKESQYPVSQEIETLIYQALANDEPLSISYLSQARDSIRKYEGYPLKLVVTPHKRLLILENKAHEDTMTFLLHRIKSAEIIDGLKTPNRVKIDIDQINDEIERHTQALWSQSPEQITLSVPIKLRYLLEDNPLFIKYLKSPMGVEDEYLQYTMKNVFITYSIIDFLVANAFNVFVVEPDGLQQEVIERLQLGLEFYGI